MEIFKQEVEVNGRKYILQHPGNREWIKLKSQINKMDADIFDWEALLDYCFNHVVFPVEGERLTLDTVDPEELEEVWQIILPRFLRRKLQNGYTYPKLIKKLFTKTK